MQSSHFLLYFFIYDPVVGNRTFPSSYHRSTRSFSYFYPSQYLFHSAGVAACFSLCSRPLSRIPRIRAPLLSQAEPSLMVQEKQNATFGIACFFFFFFFWTHKILYSGSPRIRAPLPAFAGGTFVNGPRKTNATFGVACFSFGLIKSYTQVPRAFALHCLLSQAEPSMVQEKQMPPSVSLVFLLDSLYLKSVSTPQIVSIY